VEFAGFPALFDCAVYSFMCHHSLPSIILLPWKPKRALKRLFAADYVFILVAYLALCFSALLAYANLDGRDGYGKCSSCEVGRPCELQDSYNNNLLSYQLVIPHCQYVVSSAVVVSRRRRLNDSRFW
jgi:hypothetical protein